jgi:hypothetical protein
MLQSITPSITIPGSGESYSYVSGRRTPGANWADVTMGGSESDVLTSDDIFEILSNHRRRMVLHYLQEQEDSVEVKQLAEAVAAMENGIEIEDLTSQQRKRVYVSLYQTHLPKMAEMSLIEYDRDEGTVQLSARSADINRYLSDDTDDSEPWKLPAIVLAVVAGTLAVLSLSDPTTLEAAIVVLTGGAILLTTFGVYYWRSSGDGNDPPDELREYNP